MESGTHGEADQRMVGRRARHALVAVVTTVWVVQFGAVLFAGFNPDPTVNAAFLLIAGAIFGVEAVRGSRSNNDGGDPP